jgi:hypothetical protein
MSEADVWIRLGSGIGTESQMLLMVVMQLLIEANILQALDHDITVFQVELDERCSIDAKLRWDTLKARNLLPKNLTVVVVTSNVYSWLPGFFDKCSREQTPKEVVVETTIPAGPTLFALLFELIAVYVHRVKVTHTSGFKNKHWNNVHFGGDAHVSMRNAPYARYDDGHHEGVIGTFNDGTTVSQFVTPLNGSSSELTINVQNHKGLGSTFFRDATAHRGRGDGDNSDTTGREYLQPICGSVDRLRELHDGMPVLLSSMLSTTFLLLLLRVGLSNFFDALGRGSLADALSTNAAAFGGDHIKNGDVAGLRTSDRSSISPKHVLHPVAIAHKGTLMTFHLCFHIKCIAYGHMSGTAGTTIFKLLAGALVKYLKLSPSDRIRIWAIGHGTSKHGDPEDGNAGKSLVHDSDHPATTALGRFTPDVACLIQITNKKKEEQGVTLTCRS